MGITKGRVRNNLQEGQGEARKSLFLAKGEFS